MSASPRCSRCPSKLSLNRLVGGMHSTLRTAYVLISYFLSGSCSHLLTSHVLCAPCSQLLHDCLCLLPANVPALPALVLTSAAAFHSTVSTSHAAGLGSGARGVQLSPPKRDIRTLAGRPPVSTYVCTRGVSPSGRFRLLRSLTRKNGTQRNR